MKKAYRVEKGLIVVADGSCVAEWCFYSISARRRSGQKHVPEKSCSQICLSKNIFTKINSLSEEEEVDDVGLGVGGVVQRGEHEDRVQVSLWVILGEAENHSNLIDGFALSLSVALSSCCWNQSYLARGGTAWALPLWCCFCFCSK